MNKSVRVMVFSIGFFVLASAALVSAAPGRWEKEISGKGWRLWLDRKAEWMNDTIYLPPVNVGSLPVNPPTCGWDKLNSIGKSVSVPGTVEEYYWDANGNPVGEAGDYRGVSWWSTSFTLEPGLKGKRIVLKFKSAVLRAEVFVNRKLVGYDVIGNSPFDVDITGAVRFDGENSLDIRITDPVGNFDWNNNRKYPWGKNWVPAYHGFGGITGTVTVLATDAVRIDDLYIQNKPKYTEVETFVTLGNSSGSTQNGELSLLIHEWNNPSNVLWKKTVPAVVPPEGTVLSVYVKAPKAQTWNLRDPHLYVAKAVFTSKDKRFEDSETKRFGFRYFEIKKTNGDERFYLNGKRVFILSPMCRGFWPKNGMFPTPEMLKRNMELLQTMGFTMFLMNQAIGREEGILACDEVGIVSYEEIGGYRCDDTPDKQAEDWRREKLRRMVMRDRSYPSLIIYVMKCETATPPSEDDKNNMMLMHKLDPVRIATYNSDCNRNIPETTRLPEDPFKMHMRPFDDTFHYYGWWNHHHWNPIAGYLDEYYNNPRFFLRSSILYGDSASVLDPDEIIYLGEEGDFDNTVRLQKIKEELDRTGTSGWREKEYLDWFDSFNTFLNRSGYRKVFPTVDDFTMALGVNTYYFHGRIIENCRAGNIIDGYNINSWAAGGDRTDIVDMYRNPTADPKIFSHYTQPLYVAVKIRDKVLPLGSTAVADLFIINELDLKGNHTLEVDLVDPDGQSVFKNSYAVKIKGGDDYGQLLVEGVQLPALKKPGHYNLNARILDKTAIKATGYDDIFIIDYLSGPGIKGRGAVVDTSGTINAFLKKTRGITLPEFKPSGPGDQYDFIIIGPSAPPRGRRGQSDEILDQVRNGATLFVFENADSWAQSLNSRAINYYSSSRLRHARFFVGDSKFLAGLPKAQAMNWEYQIFYATESQTGLLIDPLGTDLIVGVTLNSRKDIMSALTRIPFVNGEIFLSTLPFMTSLDSEKPQAAAAKKLFLNLLEYSGRQ
ncbi:hypothetical protein LLG96_00350 [bacterium]|nr:hypothetical protein [bacterium]